MKDSAALKRVKAHSYTEGVDTRTRQEGIYLTVEQLEDLVYFLKNDPEALRQNINRVSFMIGKKLLGRRLVGSRLAGRNNVEYTVEILPFSVDLNVTPNVATFFEQTIGNETIKGSLNIHPTHSGQAFPFSNDQGGGGGNQKTPPPSPKIP